MNRGIIGILIICMLAWSFYGIFAREMPHWKSDSDTISTDDMVIQFHERTPTYKIWIPGKNDTAVYIVKFNRIIEFIDSDNDGRYSGTVDTLLAQAPLTAHDIWEVTAEEFNTTEAYELRITFNGSVRIYRMGTEQFIGEARVAFVNHIYDRDVEVEGYQIEGGRELKIDIIISDWPWMNDDSKLALEIVFAGMFKGHEGVPRCHRERVQYENREIHKIRLEGDADYQVEFRYAEQARLRVGSEERECKVNASDEFKQNSAVTWLVYPYFNDTLVHDPSIYVGEPEGGIASILESKPYIAVGIVGVVVLVIVAIIKIKK